MAWTRACSVIELEDDKPFSAEVGDEIVAARDGVIASIVVAKGSTVNSGDLLLSLN